MPYCTNCGKEIPEGAKFCSECGTPVEKTAERKPDGNKPTPTPIQAHSTSGEETIKKHGTKPILLGLLALVAIGIVLLLVIGGHSKKSGGEEISNPTETAEVTGSADEAEEQIETVDVPSAKEEIWYDENGVKIICKNYGFVLGSNPSIQFDLYVENNSEKSIWAGIREDYIHGWKIGTTGNFCDNGLAPGTKIQQTENVYINECGLTDLSEAENYEFVLWVDLDEEDYSNEQIEIEKSIGTIPMFDGSPKPVYYELIPTELTASSETKDVAPPEIWYDENGVKITCECFGYDEKGSKLEFDFIVENDSDKSIWAGISDDYLNGWKVGTTGNFCDNGLAAGKKIRSTETVYLDDLDLADRSQVKNYKFMLWIDLDEESYDDARIELAKEIIAFPDLN